jgi:predicted helicase
VDGSNPHAGTAGRALTSAFFLGRSQGRRRPPHGEGRSRDIRTAADLAKALASFAHTIRSRIKLTLSENASEGALRASRGSTPIWPGDIEKWAGDLDGFADAYAQTTVYGLVCARIKNGKPVRALNGDSQGGYSPAGYSEASSAGGWAMPAVHPFLREIFGDFLKAAGRGHGDWLDPDELCMAEAADFLDRLGGRLHDIVGELGGNRAGEDPVIHLYEAFLKAYDPKLRQTRGVYYTPGPVVRFIVRSVDEVLRTELGLADGLADTITWGELVASRPSATIPDGVGPGEPFIKILDPATGTGAFLVEVIDLIYDRLRNNTWAGKSEAEKKRLWDAWVPEHLLPRLYGFELMAAPYAVAHLKIGLKLQDTGYDFGGKVGSDALMPGARARIFLTNALEPARNADVPPDLGGALAREARAADAAKRTGRFTVILGNPPYAGHSSNNDLPGIVESVSEYRRGWPDLQKPGQGKWLQDDYVKFFRLAEMTLRAVPCGVFSFVSNHGWLDNPTFKGMRASLKTTYDRIAVVDLHGNLKKKEASPDGSPDENIFGSISQGVSVVVATRGTSPRSVRRCDIYGREADKLEVLANAPLSSLRFTDCVSDEEPFAFVARGGQSDCYQGFESLPFIFSGSGDPAPGIVTTHDQFAISFTPHEQARKVERFLSTGNESAARSLFDLCTQGQWNYGRAKADLEGGGWLARLKPIRYRPFDVRWTVYSSSVAVHRRERVSKHLLLSGNVALLTSRQTKDRWGVAASDTLTAHKSISAYDISYVFPLWLHDERHGGARPNLDPAFTTRFAALTGLEFDEGAGAPGQRAGERGDLSSTFGARDVFDWIYAVLHSPRYRQRYADELRSDFARVPLPRGRALMAELVPLGRRLVALHLLDPDDAPDLKEPRVRFAGDGDPRVEKGYPRRQANGRVHVNALRWVEPVPESAWTQWFGGYQPAQKWLKDRSTKGGRRPAEGRVLSADDQLHYSRLIVALDETTMAMAEIDRVIAGHGGWPEAFRGMTNTSP